MRLILLLLVSFNCTASEFDYTKLFCNDAIRISNRADLGYKLSSDKIVDCLTVYGVAFEVDFAKKAWSEGVGQALHYAQQATIDYKRRFRPGVAVIVESAKDCKDVYILYSQDIHLVIVEIGPYAYHCWGL